MSRLRVAIAGSTGRMGRMLVEAALDDDDFELAGALELDGNPAIGRDAGEFLGRSTGVAISSSLDEVLAKSDFLIDFTRPEGTLAHLEACVRNRVGAVIGTTGRRVLRMAPLHHHFELSGWEETAIVVRAWVVGACLAATAVLSAVIWAF